VQLASLAFLPHFHKQRLTVGAPQQFQPCIIILNCWCVFLSSVYLPPEEEEEEDIHPPPHLAPQANSTVWGIKVRLAIFAQTVGLIKPLAKHRVKIVWQAIMMIAVWAQQYLAKLVRLESIKMNPCNRVVKGVQKVGINLAQRGLIVWFVLLDGTRDQPRRLVASLVQMVKQPIKPNHLTSTAACAKKVTINLINVYLRMQPKICQLLVHQDIFPTKLAVRDATSAPLEHTKMKQYNLIAKIARLTTHLHSHGLQQTLTTAKLA